MPIFYPSYVIPAIFGLFLVCRLSFYQCLSCPLFMSHSPLGYKYLYVHLVTLLSIISYLSTNIYFHIRVLFKSHYIIFMLHEVSYSNALCVTARHREWNKD